ncbi:MAG: aspartate/glutamate racemase, partial [Hydrogenophaga sp.]|nr:aspartate/glutamate racemase [Hydrogenophaga sp.]
MKTIGLIGGMSWESTTLYYQLINREVARRLGGLSSARLNLVSLDFQDIAQRQRAGD